MRAVKRFLPLFLLCAAAFAQADTITTTTDDVIRGTITGIRGGKVSIKTAFAGTLAIAREDIRKMAYDSTDGTMFARTDATKKEKEEVRVSHDAAGNPILIPIAAKAEALEISEVASLWAADATDPDFPPVKRWAFSVSLGFTGNSGSSNDLSMSAYADAVRSTETTTLKLYGSMNKTRSEHVRTAERYIGGFDFEHRPADYCSWYTRDEIQHNRFNDYKLRNVFGAGYGLYLWNTKTDGRVSLLRLRLGLAHTYTDHYTKKYPGTYNRSTITDSDMALDLGLLFHYDFVCGVSWNTELTYTPLLEEFEKGTLVHESKLSYLLKELGFVSETLADVSLEAGMRNEYQTRPEPGNVHTDTTWYLRLKKSW